MAFLGLEPKQMYEVPAADDLLFKLMNFLDELRQHSLFTIHYSLLYFCPLLSKRYYERGQLVYGIHASDTALVTCVVTDYSHNMFIC